MDCALYAILGMVHIMTLAQILVSPFRAHHLAVDLAWEMIGAMTSLADVEG